MVCGGDPAPAAPTGLQESRATARPDSRPVPEKTMVMWILFAIVTFVFGLILGFMAGSEAGESKAYQVIRDPEIESLSPAERRRKANRPWT